MPRRKQQRSLAKKRVHFLYMHGRKRSNDTEKREKEARCSYVPG
jgi:hypothetical protein